MKEDNHKSALSSSNLLKALLLPLIIISAGYLFALQADADFQSNRRQAVIDALEERMDQISDAVEERLSLYAHGIISLRSAIKARGEIETNYTYISAYADNQNYPEKYPGARGLGYIKLIERSQLEDFLDTAATDRPDGSFSLRTLTPHSNSLFVIQYIMPEEANRQAIGLDIGSETMRRRSAIRAAQTNSVQLTAPITLVQANQQKKHGFLILAPVYHSQSPPEQQSKSSEGVKGWTYAPLVIGEILSTVKSIDNSVMLSITDETNDSAVTFFDSGDVKSSAQLNQLSYSVTTALYGRTWRLTITPTESFINNMALPPSNQAFNSVMVIAVCIALILLSAHVVFMRVSETKAHQREIVATRTKALEQSKAELEQKVKERTYEIQKANALQRSILNATEYAIIATDEAGIITVFNPGAQKLLGYSAQDMVGIHSPAVFHIESEIVDRAHTLSEEAGYTIEPGFEVFVHKAKQGLTDNNPWTYMHKDGHQIPVRLSITRLMDDSGNIFGFLGVAYDLTAQMQHENELAQAKELAESANVAKSEFLANMSHEIRTPMNGIYGTLQTLKKNITSDKNASLLDNALQSTRNLNVIINDILDFSKIEAGKLAIDILPFSISSLLDAIDSQMQAMVQGKQVVFTVTNHIDHDFWQGDDIRVRQVLLNVCSNAIKFTEKGTVSVDVSTSSDTLILEVTDTGIGMSEEELSRLFSRFEQADSSTTRKYGGTGIGMAITRSLVELMGGDIEVTSQKDKGSKFRIAIPTQKADALNPSDTTTGDSEIPDLSRYTILVAEDNEINRVVIEDLLLETGASVHFANNGAEAVDASTSIELDLILMDIQMPIMDGIEACRRIKLSNPVLPVIALTANVMVDDIARYEKEGFDAHLAKPIEFSELLDKLRIFLRR